MKKFVEKDVAENPLYHDTWKLLKKYRDVVWSLEISVQHVRSKFERIRSSHVPHGYLPKKCISGSLPSHFP